MRYIYTHAYLEITRKCNLHCAHCMRGPAQNIEISKEDVDLFFEKLDGVIVENLTIGGGEPTLNPDMIVYIIDKLISERFNLVYLNMITNGQTFNQDVADAFRRYDEYVKESCIPGGSKDYVNHRVNIAFSVDKYHKPVSNEVREAYKKACPYVNITNYLVTDDKIIRSGFATFGHVYKHRLIRPKYRIKNDEEIKIYDGFYLTARGEVTTNGEGEYADVDLNNFGHIRDFKLLDFLIEKGLPLKGSPNIADVVGTPRKMIRSGE